MTSEQLQAIKTRCEKAMRWSEFDGINDDTIKFHANAKEDIAALLAEVERLSDVLEKTFRAGGTFANAGYNLWLKNEQLKDEIKSLKAKIGCDIGCGICLAHNNMICPKLKEGKDD